MSNGLLYEVENGTGRYILLHYDGGPAMTLTNIADSQHSRIFCSNYDEATNSCQEVTVNIGTDWECPGLEYAAVGVKCGADGIWRAEKLKDCKARILIDGEELDFNSKKVFNDQSVLNIANVGEFIASCPPFSVEDMSEDEPKSQENDKTHIAKTISSEFVAKEVEEVVPVIKESGTQRAWRLNRALKRALCTRKTTAEQKEDAERAKKYKDRYKIIFKTRLEKMFSIYIAFVFRHSFFTFFEFL